MWQYKQQREDLVQGQKIEEEMKAMIFAAGLGTRLQPLTDNKPKAMVPFRGQPLLFHAISYLKQFGVDTVVVNVHHFAQQVIDYIQVNNGFGIQVLISDESDELLDTGGGLKNAAGYFKNDEDIIVLNTDVLTDLDLNAMLDCHRRSGALATLAVRKRVSSRYLLVDENAVLCGWRNTKSGEQIIARKSSSLNDRAFSGVHIIKAELLDKLQPIGKFSIIQSYLQLATNNVISSYDHSESYWFDMGKIETFDEADKIIPELNN